MINQISTYTSKNDNCAICLEKINTHKASASLQCGHVFGFSCYQTSLKILIQQQEPTPERCIICRRYVRSRTITFYPQTLLKKAVPASLAILNFGVSVGSAYISYLFLPIFFSLFDQKQHNYPDFSLIVIAAYSLASTALTLACAKLTISYIKDIKDIPPQIIDNPPELNEYLDNLIVN